MLIYPPPLVFDDFSKGLPLEAFVESAETQQFRPVVSIVGVGVVARKAALCFVVVVVAGVFVGD